MKPPLIIQWAWCLVLAGQAIAAPSDPAANSPPSQLPVPPKDAGASSGTGAAVANSSGTNTAAKTQPPSAAPLAAEGPKAFQSAWAREILRLAHAGVDDRVMLAFAANAPGTFNLSSEQIIHLRDQGISSQVINAMLVHDQEVSLGLFPVTSSTLSLPSANPTTNPADAARPASPVTPPLQPALSSTTAAVPAPVNPIPWYLREPINVFADYGPGELEAAVAQAWAGVYEESEEAPEQPDSLYRVRLPYPVKLTSRIIVLRSP